MAEGGEERRDVQALATQAAHTEGATNPRRPLANGATGAGIQHATEATALYSPLSEPEPAAERLGCFLSRQAQH